MTQAVVLAGTIVFSAALVVLGSLAIVMGLTRRTKARNLSPDATADAVFIFRDKALMDCSDRGQGLMASLDMANHSDWSALMDYLAPRFPGIEPMLEDVPRTGRLSLDAVGETPLHLTATSERGMLRIVLSDLSDEVAILAMDRLGYEALQKELQMLRFVLRAMPGLVWQEDAEGQVIWANSAYLKAIEDCDTCPSILSWPLPAVFDQPGTISNPRLTLERQGRTSWFSHVEVAGEGATLHFATPIDATVQSETARRQTLQTLTHTFSALPIGLALFDADRRLQVFNPALVDLTGLQPLFLAARPSFEGVLYALRESRMLPEPKDFNSWRAEIIDMEKAAQSGVYAEEWTLENGKTYLVTGRPQPDGAIALFLQDITTEATLSRSFRAEIETAQNALDRLEQGVVVFGLHGEVLLANAEYTGLWNMDPCSNLADRGFANALSVWAEACEPTAFWPRFADFVAARLREPGPGATRSEITGTATLRTGGDLQLRACRLAGGRTMLTILRVQGQSGALLPQRPEGADAPARPQSIPLGPEPETMLALPARHPVPALTGESLRKARTARHSGTRVRA